MEPNFSATVIGSAAYCAYFNYYLLSWRQLLLLAKEFFLVPTLRLFLYYNAANYAFTWAWVTVVTLLVFGLFLLQCARVCFRLIELLTHNLDPFFIRFARL